MHINTYIHLRMGFPGGTDGKESACNVGFPDPRVGKITWRRAWQPTPVFLLENSTHRGP